MSDSTINHERSDTIIERKDWPIYRRAWLVFSEEGIQGTHERIRRKLEWWLHRWKGAPIDDLYDTQFFIETELANNRYTEKLADWIVSTITPSDVLDVGSGDGVLLKALHERGIRCYGVDGSIVAVRRLPKDIFAFRSDLAKPLVLNRSFPLVTCLEVAEHLPAGAASTIVKNLADHAEHYILFSAAHPGQGGRDHVNERPLDYWVQKFGQIGFAVVPELTNTAKWALRNSGGPDYFQKNLVILRKCSKT